jgi:hypothetical protein
MSRSILIVTLIFCFGKLQSQNVGIGTTSPQHALDINGQMRIKTNPTWGASRTMLFYADYYRASVGVKSNSSVGIFFYGDATGVLLNPDNMNVGIGLVESPAYPLESAGVMRIKNTASTAGFWMNNSANALHSFFGVLGAGKVGFYSAGAGNIFVHNIPNGYTGIGTDNPTAALDVDGTIRISDANAAKGSILISQDDSGSTAWHNTTAFRVGGLVNGANQTLPHGTWTKLLLNSSASFNYNGGYQGATSEFVAPVDGIYEFNIQTTMAPNSPQTTHMVRLMRNRQGVISSIFSQQQRIVVHYLSKRYFPGANTLKANSGLLSLEAGDKVWVEVNANGPVTPEAMGNARYTWFTGEIAHLL